MRVTVACAGGRLWQEYHATFLPTDNVAELMGAFPDFIDTHLEAPSAVWRDVLAEEASYRCVEQVMRDLLRLYVFTTVCDPPMKFDASSVAKEHKFDPECDATVDDKIKPGKACVVLCPALYSADGIIKAKAKVLASDYL